MTDAQTSAERRAFALALLRQMAVTIFHDRPTLSLVEGERYALEACHILHVPTVDVPHADIRAVFREEWDHAHPLS